MRKIIAFLLVCTVLTACGEDRKGETSRSGSISISDVYSFAVPAGFPAAAVFMTIDNDGNTDDRLVGFQSDLGERAELHTMAMEGDIMRMRQVQGYNIPADENHILKPGGDHIMIIGLNRSMTAGETFNGVASFEQAGDIQINIKIRPREEMNMQSQ